MAGRKRVYGGKSSVRPYKRARKTFKRPTRRRGANSLAYNNQNGIGKSLPFKSRKISRKAWNHKLWDSTLQKTHYRSNGAATGAVSTPVANNQASVTRVEALNNGVAQFWQSTGGAIEVDAGEGVPTFEDDIIIRGGKVGLTLFNLGGDGVLNTAPVRVEIFLIKNVPRPTYSSLPGTVSIGWDPSLVPEFTRDIGRIVWRREIIMEPQTVFNCERRIGLMKIDQEAFATDSERYQWLVVANDYVSGNAISINVVNYFNLSFCGDVNAAPV